MFHRLRVAVVVPAYNEEELIGETLSSVPGFVDRVYAVDDGSLDSTFRVIQRFAERDSRVVPLRRERNGGVGAAVVAGYRCALRDEMDVAVVMAGDNQMDPAYLPKLLEPIVEGRADYTKGNRLLNPEHRRGMSKWRFFGNIVLTFLTRVASGYWDIGDPQNGYTAISRRAIEKVDPDTVYTYYGYPNDLLVKLNVFGFRVVDVPHPARYGREKSKIRYTEYIVKISWLLLRDFYWRLKMKYFKF